MPKPQRRIVKKAYQAPQRVIPESGEVQDLLDRKQWSEAREVLTSLAQRYPQRVDVLTDLVNVNYELHDLRGYFQAAERLIKLVPDDPDLTLGLAGAYLSTIHPALALRTFRRFLDRWPDDARAADVRRTVADVEATLYKLIPEVGAPGPEALEHGALHEEVQILVEQGDYLHARRAAERLLARVPDFVPGLNNLSQAYALEGQVDRAIAIAQRVLSLAPNNFHALSNLCRYYCLSGRLEAARLVVEQLKAVVETVHVDVWVKKAEALTYLGDDQGVLDAFRGAERACVLKVFAGNALLYHLAAVAALRLGGRGADARRYWREALKLEPSLTVARDNLADLEKPVGERHAPWPFDLAQWLSAQARQDLLAVSQGLSGRSDTQAVDRAVQRYLRQHPEVVPLVPLLLDRGDPMGREFALRTALLAKSPELLSALRDFALSQRGPDAMRLEAAQAASQAGLLPQGPVRMWSQGVWHDVLMFGFEIHDEPVQVHGRQVERLARDAAIALRAGEATRVESLLKQALAIEPDAPDLLHNLAATYGRQARLQEMNALLDEIHQRHPEYLFARTSLATLRAQKGQSDEAKALLEPLLSRRRFHISEFRALCSAQIEVSLAKGDREVARSWLEMWASADPDNPMIDIYRERLEPKGLRRRLFGR